MAPPPPTTLPSLRSELNEADARSWLERFRAAWERKDGAALLQLGAISPAAVPKIASHADVRSSTLLKGFQPGASGAEIDFDRTDVLRENGQEVTVHYRCELSKTGGEVVAHGCQMSRGDRP